MIVVICFQSFLSLLFFQTERCGVCNCPGLWFAFRVFFRYCSFKRIRSFSFISHSCDLLSEFSFVTVLSNFLIVILRQLLVVICFQSFLSLLFFQTNKLWLRLDAKLWFAFRVFFRYCSFKRIRKDTLSPLRCDLLSEFSFVTVLSNIKRSLGHAPIVVICFQSFLSLLFFQT